MSVDGRHRRQGLGRKVVEELVQRARRRGMVEVVVLTDTPWTSAVELYRSCGFAEVGEDGVDTHFALRLAHVPDSIESQPSARPIRSHGPPVGGGASDADEADDHEHH